MFLKHRDSLHTFEPTQKIEKREQLHMKSKILLFFLPEQTWKRNTFSHFTSTLIPPSSSTKTLLKGSLWSFTKNQIMNQKSPLYPPSVSSFPLSPLPLFFPNSQGSKTEEGNAVCVWMRLKLEAEWQCSGTGKSSRLPACVCVCVLVQ